MRFSTLWGRAGGSITVCGSATMMCRLPMNSFSSRTNSGPRSLVMPRRICSASSNQSCEKPSNCHAPRWCAIPSWRVSTM